MYKSKGVLVMANSLKCMWFSIIGFVVFFIIGTFLPLVTIISSGFGLFAAISLIVYIFEKIHTRHHFLKSTIGFIIFSGFSFVILTCNTLFVKVSNSDDYLIELVNQILKYGFLFSAVYCVASLVILLLDLCLGFVNFTKERDTVPIKIFRLGVYWTYIVGGLGAISIFSITEINIVAQLFLLLMYVFNIVTISILINCYTVCKSNFKLILINIITLFISTGLLLYFKNYDVLTNYFSIKETSAVFICKCICHVWTLLLILQFAINMIISIFKHKTTIFSCFVSILYAALGLICSCVVYYDKEIIPYRIEMLRFIYYYSIIVFAVFIGVSFMSSTYKLIFTKTETTEVEKINIDED